MNGNNSWFQVPDYGMLSPGTRFSRMELAFTGLTYLECSIVYDATLPEEFEFVGN